MLTERYANAALAEKLLSREQFTPFPTREERGFWEKFPEELQRMFIQEGEACLGFEYPFLPAVRYMDYARNGNRTRYQTIYYQRRIAAGTLAMAECFEGQGRFLDDLINGIWGLCEESSWVVPAHNGQHRNGQPLPDVTNPDIDLFAAETGALLSWIHYLLKDTLDEISPLICQRIRNEVRKRILTPYLKREDLWWMGFMEYSSHHINNWNPWCNSNCLTAFLFLEDDPERRIQAVTKVLKSLDHFLDGYFDDGGCDEGPSYWNHAGGSLFDDLELLHLATEGHIDVYDEPLIQNIGKYIYRMQIHDKYFVNFADGNAKLDIAAELIYRYGRRIGDKQLSALGLSDFHANGGKMVIPHQYPIFRVLSYIRNYETMRQKPAAPPYVRDVWLDGIQVMAAREQEGSARGLYLAAKGGHNNESHNHNDVGHVLVYADGEPVLIDAGVGTYTSKTFSSERYTIWTMQSAYHNLPTVNGVHQGGGEQFKASDVQYQVTEGLVEYSLNLAAAYPEDAGIKEWKRCYRFHRNGSSSIEIFDDFTLDAKTNDIMLSLITACEHSLEQAGVVLFQGQSGKNVRLEYDSSRLEASTERIPIGDERLSLVWGDHLYRIVLRTTQETDQGHWAMKITLA